MDKLKSTVSKLHETLARTDHVDPELRGLLETLDHDIRLALARQDVADTREPGLKDRVLELAVRFGAEHPVLDSTLREIADMLGKMGI